MTFTKEYFFQEISRFRKLMGDKAFFNDDTKMESAITGLSHVYFNVDDFDDSVSNLFKSTIEEYNQRKNMMALYQIA